MKKFLSLIIAVVFALGLKAQTTLTEAPDFIAPDYFGNEIHLYEILEKGQYVLLYINVTSGDEINTITPPLVEAYNKLGCNQHDVFFVGVIPNGTTKITGEYVDEYGIEFPIIHNTDESNGMAGPAMDIWRAHNCNLPTTILIAPDKSIALDDIYPIETSDDVVSALAEFGIQEYECGEEPANGPAVEIGVIDITETTIEASFTPNDECASYFILCDSVGSMEQWTTVFGVTLEQLIEQWSIARTEPSTNLWKDLIPDTDYVIYVLPKDAEGKSGELQTHIVRTVAMGGEGVSVIDVKVEILTTTSVRVVATPNEETAEYHYILIEKSFSDSIGIDSTMKFLYEDPYALYEIDDWTWEELLPNTEYYAVAQGKNIKGEWGEITKVEFVTTVEEEPEDPEQPDGIEELSSSFKIYPNPASTEIKITSQLNGEADVRIYDMTGRCVKDIHVNDMNNATINISDIDNGLYLININGSFEKLIIE